MGGKADALVLKDMFSTETPSDSEEEGCYVFWETKSILAPVPGSSSGPSRASRSDAPSPSLGCTSTGTPKAKRTTSLASLPSPSGSTSLTARPLRQRKKRKALGRRDGAQQASSQPLDAHTLRMVSQLAMKVNARAAGLASPVVTRSAVAAATPSADAKGKGKEVEERTSERPAREPLRPSTSGSNTPLRRPPARSPQNLLTLSTASTKSSLSKSSDPSSVSKLSLPIPPPPPLLRTTSTTTLEEEDEDSYFDEGDSFEIALSQLDESLVTASPPLVSLPAAEAPVKPPPKPAAFKPAAARLPSIAPVRSSPRLARQAAASERTSATAAASRTTSTRLHLAAPTAAPPPRPAPPPRAPSLRPPVPPSSSQSASNVKTRGTLSAAKQREMEELARREVEALEALGGAGEWSDEDF
ncbi:hypothetical protein JCM6882_001583 [Rhodosporidiobolus microsporus]